MAPAAEARTYHRSQGIVFFKTREAFGQLSNMCSGYPLTVAGAVVPSAEALYQACRFPHLPDVQKRIISQTSPMTAKMVSKPYRAQTRPGWDEGLRVAVMKWCLRVKLVQHWAEFGGILQKTGKLPIIEQSSKDPFWGAIPEQDGKELRGANVLGRLLMELREVLRNNPSELNVIEPLEIPDFLLLGRPIEPIQRLRLVHSAEAPLLASLDPQKHEKPMQQEPVARPRRQRKSARRDSDSQGQLAMFEAPSVAREKAAPKRKVTRYHVVASKRGGWDVLKDNAKRVSAHFGSKVEATTAARALASKHKLELFIHDKTGNVVQRVKPPAKT